MQLVQLHFLNVPLMTGLNELFICLTFCAKSRTLVFQRLTGFCEELIQFLLREISPDYLDFLRLVTA